MFLQDLCATLDAAAQCTGLQKAQYTHQREKSAEIYKYTGQPFWMEEASANSYLQTVNIVYHAVCVEKHRID